MLEFLLMMIQLYRELGSCHGGAEPRVLQRCVCPPQADRTQEEEGSKDRAITLTLTDNS